jgi:hypothetical protein
MFWSGTDFLCGGVRTPRNYLHAPRGIWHRPQKFLHTPANYIYFDLIVSSLIILTTKFVKLPILWSQISPCRPRKQILLNFFLGLSGRCHHALPFWAFPPRPGQSKQQHPPSYLSTTPPNKNMKIWFWLG